MIFQIVTTLCHHYTKKSCIMQDFFAFYAQKCLKSSLGLSDLGNFS